MNRERFIKNLSDFVRIPSESGNEKEFIEYIEKFSKNLGAKTFIDSYGNLIAKFPAKNSDKKEYVGFGFHADTVKPGIGIEPIVEGDIMKSKGETILGADDKAGVAEFFEMLLNAKKHPPIELILAREEEVGSKGSRNLDYSKVESKFAYVIDMEEIDWIVLGGPTYLLIDIDIIGKSSHAGMAPEKGISSIHVAANAISKLKLGKYDSESTQNIGVINGGAIRNGIPEKTTIMAEVRSLNHEKAVKISEETRATFEKEAKALGAKLDFKVSTAMKAYKLDESSKVVSVLKESMLKNNIKPNFLIINGGTDAAHFAEHGVPTAVLGCGYRKEHCCDEYLDLKEAEKITKVITDIVESLA